MFGHCFEMRAPLVADGGVRQRGAANRLVELILGALELRRNSPQWRIPHNRSHASGEVLHECACLQLADRAYRASGPVSQVPNAG
jgi:hypothetical protein